MLLWPVWCCGPSLAWHHCNQMWVMLTGTQLYLMWHASFCLLFLDSSCREKSIAPAPSFKLKFTCFCFRRLAHKISEFVAWGWGWILKAILWLASLVLSCVTSKVTAFRTCIVLTAVSSCGGGNPGPLHQDQRLFPSSGVEPATLWTVAWEQGPF